MENDDLPVGRLLSRREAIVLLGAGGLAAAGGWKVVAAQTASGAPQCVVRPETTEGPYFIEKQLERSDIRVESSTGTMMPGVPLALAFSVSQIAGGRCTPLPHAVVDVWQCDAVGVYSGVSDPRFDGAARNQSFLRGLQKTDAGGTARFVTVYPGWYAGRAVHVHFKIRTPAPAGQTYEFTAQLFFPESLNDVIHAQAPYAAKGRRDMTNERDGIYRRGGSQLLLEPVKSATGYDAAFSIGLDLADVAVGRPDGGRGRGRGGG